MIQMIIHVSYERAPKVAIRVDLRGPENSFAELKIGDIEHSVFRKSEADVSAWLTDLRDKIDAALAAPAPDPVPQHASSPSAADLSAVALAKADAAGGASPPAPAAGSADTPAEASDV